MKSKRQSEILRIIAAQDIETQEQMLESMRECGSLATQATISQAIKELNLVKQPTGDGTYKHVVTSSKQPHDIFAG